MKEKFFLFFKKLEGELRDREEVLKSAKFTLTIVLVFLGLHFLAGLVPIEWVQYFYAWVVQKVIFVFGIESEILFAPVQLVFEKFTAEISYLCTGLLETVLVVAAILSSHGINYKKRIAGAFFAFIATVLLNVFRISATILAIVFVGVYTGEFFHEVLFRIFLFVAIAGIYAAWFFWATKK
jgi:exosortase/archaeosortase family protein